MAVQLPLECFQCRRAHYLSRSLYVYSCGRVSEIWHRPPGLYSIMPSKRTLQLAEPRKYSEMYLKQRPRSSPLWPVTISALYSKASQRILTLAQPRCLLSSFTLPREPQSSVSKAARRATASTRTECLAKPVFKKYPMCYENRFMEAPIREVSLAAQKAVPSPRIVELAKAKMLPAESFPERSPEWPVSVAAKHAVASPRLGELAQPPKRAPTHFVQFDPEAFTVKEAAKKAYCSERVVELAQPITR
ncbi:sperm microtubule associated protein 2-like isoform X2 [Rhineura floridana]|uniref:sperm microtubule associated protein 2-like isoform X2 n=1 Tax=Rhineura floridana TaxID=261503 RepID=UPI002AC8015C|nr:sperm microtubule associated protein 2-like isoform X2 [Rhineura floridana]